MIQLSRPLELGPVSEVMLPASKSISNRLLLLQAFEPAIVINNLSEANDTLVLKKALTNLLNASGTLCELDAADAGTAFRFLLAYGACTKGSYRLTGTARLQRRPIKQLVEALRSLGAKIEYENKEGFAPLRITGTQLQGGDIIVDASVSSQFISALLMIGWTMPSGLRLRLHGQVVSEDYIHMTIQLLHQLGVTITKTEDTIAVSYSASLTPQTFEVERDWSSAGYFYALMLGCKQGSFLLKGLTLSMIQADAVIVQHAAAMGVKTEFTEKGALIYYEPVAHPASMYFNCIQCPDLAQTLMVMCCMEGIEGVFDGLSTLEGKETNRIVAMQVELLKIGWQLQKREKQYVLHPTKNKVEAPAVFDTYRDHRMAMSLAALLTKRDVCIREEEVVHKSFPLFWKQLANLGVKITQL